jgi:hypothetical protein
MRVIVFAQDLSGRRDHGHYTKPDLASALDLFFTSDGSKLFLDVDGADEVTREDAEAAFEIDRQVTFYNESGERTVITADPCP